MAMPTRETAVTTIEELLALPDDGKRHELLDGVHVVTPAPEYPHQGVLAEFSLALGKALEGQDELRLLSSPADIVLSPRTLVQPDLFVVRKQAGQILKKWSEVGVPRAAGATGERRADAGRDGTGCGQVGGVMEEKPEGAMLSGFFIA